VKIITLRENFEYFFEVLHTTYDIQSFKFSNLSPVEVEKSGIPLIEVPPFKMRFSLVTGITEADQDVGMSLSRSVRVPTGGWVE
jgi:hypothetical protein